MSRTWFITGASSGIGRLVTEQLLERGDRVAATARRPELLADLLKRHEDQLWTGALDVTDPEAIRDVTAQVLDRFGRIDVVYSNAGRGVVGAAEELSIDAIDQQIALNMTAPIHLLRAVLPHFRAQGGGRFIQMSSMGAHISTPGGSMYHASKWGVEGFLESVLPEVSPFGVGITMVEPGVIRTAFGAHLEVSPDMPEYEEGPVGQIRRYIESIGNVTANAPGNPERVAAAIVASADISPAPRRLALGSDAYRAIRAALVERIAELDSGQSVATATDF